MKQNRVEQLRHSFSAANVEAMVITNPYNRRYLTGFTGTAGIVLITETDALLFTDFRYTEQAREQAPHFTIVEHKTSIQEVIAHELKQRKITRLGFEQEQVTYSQYQLFAKHFPFLQLVPLTGQVEKLRMIKDEQEIGIIKQAAAIVDQTYTHILKMVKPGMREIEVANELEFQMRRLGASSSSFTIIVASGLRSALPHGVASEKVLESGDFITLDFGAYYQGYCSDMTRTFALGEPSPQLQAIYQICLTAQEKGVKEIKAGLTGKQADAICRDYIKEQGFGPQFGHSTGHGIGLEIHEDPRLSIMAEEPLQPGMVVTVEPGIYLPNVGGVRIEDDIVIRENGNECLTHSPKHLIIL